MVVGDPEMTDFWACQKQALFISSIPQEPAGWRTISVKETMYNNRFKFSSAI